MEKAILDIKKVATELSTDGHAKRTAQLVMQRTMALLGKLGGADKAAVAASVAGYLADTRYSMERRGPHRAPPSGSAGRRELCRYLGEIAGPKEVAPLSKLLDDLEIREAVRAVLGQIPGDEATAALAQVATDADGTTFRLGAVAALGRRTGAGATDALRKCADDPDPRVRAAAAAAMANGAEPGFDGAIQAALDPAKGLAPHADANRLRLRLASNLAKAGHKAEAKRVFDAVAASSHEACCRKAVDCGLKALGGQ